MTLNITSKVRQTPIRPPGSNVTAGDAGQDEVTLSLQIAKDSGSRLNHQVRPGVQRVFEGFDTPLGLAKNAAHLHSKLDSALYPPVSVGNWIPAPHSENRDGQAPPFHVPDPSGDAYLAGLNVAALDQGEEAISPRLMPGWVEHLQDIGILPHDAVIHQVDFNVAEVTAVKDGHSERTLGGFPHTDILSRAAAQDLRLRPGQLVSVTFPSPYVREQVRRIGGVLVQDSDAARTNNKHEFRQAADAYGFSVFPGASVSSRAELIQRANELRRDYERTQSLGGRPMYLARLKDPCSSGGDGVRGIEAHMPDDAVLRALDGILDGIERSYQLADYADRSMALRWRNARNSTFPSPLVLEYDAAMIGDVVFNGSFMVEIHADGRYSVPRFFGQKTDSDGSFRGGYTVDKTSPRWKDIFSDSVENLLSKSIDGVVRYWHSELGVRGMAGVDFMLVRRYEDSETVPYLFDPNVRPTINSISDRIARKVERVLGFSAWENMNGWASAPLTSMADFQQLLNLGPGLNFYDGCEDGIVVPIAHRSVFQRDGNGAVSCPRPSCATKFLVAAKDEAAVDKITRLLSERRGLRYNADER